MLLNMFAVDVHSQRKHTQHQTLLTYLSTLSHKHTQHQTLLTYPSTLSHKHTQHQTLLTYLTTLLYKLKCPQHISAHA